MEPIELFIEHRSNKQAAKSLKLKHKTNFKSEMGYTKRQKMLVTLNWQSVKPQLEE
jgi:hypothetical protein